MNVFDLVAKITLDSSEYDKGLANSEGKAQSFGSKLKSGLVTAGKIGVGAMAAVGTAVVGVSAVMAKQTGEVAAYGDNIDKMSQKMGISAQAYQEWDAIMQHSGTSIDSMQRGMVTLAKAAEDNSDAFQKLGISQEEVANMSQEDLFARTIAGLQGMEEGTERTALAQKLLGGSAKELGALLNTSAEDTEAMRQRVHELGGVMSDEAVKAAAAYQDSLQDMQTSVDGLKRGLISDFMPSITTVMDGLTAIFSGDGETGLGLLKTGISDAIQQIQEAAPMFLEAGGEILKALYQAIMDNLPQIAEGGTELLINLITGIVGALPELIPAVVTMVVTIVQTLWQHFPEIIQAGRDAVSSLTSGMDPQQLVQKGIELLTNLIASIAPYLPQMLIQGIQLVTQLAVGLIRAIPQIVAAIPQIIRSVAQPFSSYDWGAIGMNLIRGIGRGIADAAGSLAQMALNAVKAAWDTMTGFLKISSPSKLARDVIGKNWAAGIGIGFTEGMPTDDMVGAVEDTFNQMAGMPELSFDTNYQTIKGGSDGGAFAPVINVYGAAGQDVNELANIVMDKLSLAYRRKKVSYAY